MTEDTDNSTSSPAARVAIGRTSKLKRKKPVQQSPESPFNPSDSSNAAESRAKRAPRASRSPQKKKLAVESPLKDAVDSDECPELVRYETGFPKTPSPKMDNGQPTGSSPHLQSPGHGFTSDPMRPASATPEPPRRDLTTSSPRNTFRPAAHPSLNTINSRVFPFAVNCPTAQSFAPSANSLNAITMCTGGSKLTAKRHSLFQLNPSPLGSAPIQSADFNPASFHPPQNIHYPQSSAEFQQDSQMHQKMLLGDAMHLGIENVNDNPEYDRVFATYKEKQYTLKECILVVALKSFVKHSGANAGERLNDDTITEILQFRRGWCHPDGLNCQGLYSTLLHPYGNTRAIVDGLLRENPLVWEEFSWTCYRSWLNAMKRVCASIKNQHMAKHEAVRRSQMSFANTYNPFQQHLPPQEQVSGERNSQTGNNDYFNEPLPKIQATAAHMGTLEELSEKGAVGERDKRLNEWVANEMVTTNFHVMSEGGEKVQHGEGINDGYLPQMEPLIDAEAFSFD